MRAAELEVRCERTDLFVSQCAHCRHIEGPAKVATGEFGPPIRARYDGACAACGGLIQHGETIARLVGEDGWACERCLP